MKKINRTKTEIGNQPTPVAHPQIQPSIETSGGPSSLALVAPPVSSPKAIATIEARPLAPIPVQSAPSPAPRVKHRRHGHVARLPRVQRDMVNRMLWNNIPYKNIVAALDEAGFAVSERNISNWATGGHLEWRLEQEAVLDNRLNQEHLLGFLRREDAPELPEVGLQAAATRLSQVLLAKLDRADDPEANLDSYSRMVDLLCRLNRELGATQKNRDDSRRTLGPEHDPVRVQDVENLDAIYIEQSHSLPEFESDLPKSAERPLLPGIPTAKKLAEQAAVERLEAETRRINQRAELLKRFLPQPAPPVSAPPRKVTEGNGK